MESSSLQELEQIPGVGKTIAQDMQNIGIHSIDALKGRQAEQLYDRLCEFKASPACPVGCVELLRNQTETSCETKMTSFI